MENKKPSLYHRIVHKASEGIVRFRLPILILILVALGFAIYGFTQTKINGDILSYLPEGTDTYEGSHFLSEQFDISSEAVYAVKGESVTYEDLSSAVEKAKEHEHVSEILWIGTMSNLEFEGLPISDPFALIENGDKATEKQEEFFRKDGNYALIVTLDVGGSTTEAGAALKHINAALDEIGAEYASGGTAPVSQEVYDSAVSEMPINLAVAILLVLVVLFLVSANWLEPVVFMLTMGVSIAINMGTNLIFPSVSIITFCAASLLQLALAMDYSIFLTQIYSEERQRGLPDKGAMANAIGTTLNTVFASAMTTMGGFAAFFMMSFTLGADLGGVLIKGIFLAMLTVLVLQPCLMILLSKPMARTKHKRLIHLEFRAVARFSVNHRIILSIVFLALLAPAFIGQLFQPLSYLNFLPETKGDPELVAYVDAIGNQLFIAAPVDPDDPMKNITFAQDLEAIDGVTSVTGYYAFLPKESFNEKGDLLLKGGIPLNSVKIGTDAGFITEDGYTLYLVSFFEEYDLESEQAAEVLHKVKEKANETFAPSEVYAAGLVQAVDDFRTITPRDFRRITAISVAIIFAVLLLTFRDPVYPFLLVLLIELGTWINFSISTIFGQSLNFLAYIVVGAIQLGATVDYAILITNKYRSLIKTGMRPTEAAYEAGTSCTMSVLTSASILVVSCVSAIVISSNAVIREVTMMCLRGAVISTVLVLFILPSLLACTSRLGIRVKKAGGIFPFTKEIFTQAKDRLRYIGLILKAKRRVKTEKLLGKNERLEDLEAHGLIILQPEKGYRFNSDSVILANLAEVKEGERVYDLGCGSAVMSLLIAAKRNAAVVGVELQESLASMAQRSVRANDYEEKVKIVAGDVRRAEELFPAGDADVIVMNPPYFKAGSGEVSHDEMQAIARHEITLTLPEELVAIRHLLKKEGKAFVLFPTSREKEFDKAVLSHDLFLCEKIYLTSSIKKAPESFIAKITKLPPEQDENDTLTGEPKTRILVTKDRQGNMSKEVAALYRG